MKLSQPGENSDKLNATFEYNDFYNNELSSEIDSIKSIYDRIKSADSTFDNTENLDNILKVWRRIMFKIGLFLNTMQNDDVNGYILEKLLKMRLHKLGNGINHLNVLFSNPNYEIPAIDWDELNISDSDILNPEGGSLRQFLENNCKKYGATLSSLNPKLSDCNISSFHPLIFGEILSELVMNARHAGAEHVTVSLEETNDAYVVSVEDDGKGIKKGHLSNIFKEGFTTRAEGTGKGLFLSSKYITEFMRGKVSVESVCFEEMCNNTGSVHCGTVIRMTLPKDNAHL